MPAATQPTCLRPNPNLCLNPRVICEVPRSCCAMCWPVAKWLRRLNPRLGSRSPSAKKWLRQLGLANWIPFPTFFTLPNLFSTQTKVIKVILILYFVWCMMYDTCSIWWCMMMLNDAMIYLTMYDDDAWRLRVMMVMMYSTMYDDDVWRWRSMMIIP